MGLQVIFGSGPVGLATAGALLDEGLDVRMVNRSGRLDDGARLVLPEGAEGRLALVRADATDPADARRAAEGASHVYHCINPLYHQWADVLPRVQENLIEAALGQGAVLAASENLYMYARGVAAIGPDAPIDPPTRKGAIRRRLHEALVAAGREKGLRWVTIRASDYFGPGSAGQSVFGTQYFLDPLFAGKRAMFLGNLKMPHTFTYSGDFGRALALAARTEKAWGRPWIVANDVTTDTETIARMFLEKSGRTVPLGRIPRAALSLAGLFDPVIREVGEMLYQKTEPYVVDGSEFRKAFGFETTPLEEAVDRTLAWYGALREKRAALKG